MTGGQPTQFQTGRTGSGLQPVTVADVVQTDVVTVEPETSIASVVGELADENVGSVVVVEDDRPTGVLTDRQICLALDDEPQVTERSAGDLVTGDVVTGSVEETVFDVVDRLSEETVRRLPIVDEEGRLQGIVTLDDLLVVLGGELQQAVEVIRHQSPRM